ncbi:LIX1-like protein [Clavelina lepadiformis]|uniref:LIX1-like protein n=1 Tax=Clavelina lepadiformis TaxID=159417 RepID=UPI0040437936
MEPINNALSEAVAAVVNSFKKHSDQKDVDVVEALQEFWQMKHTRAANLHHSATVTYEFLPVLPAMPPYVCYVTLPGGSCFGTFQRCESAEKAKQSAAKIALMHSVFNEHPSSFINKATIKKVIMDASASFSSRGNESSKSLHVFKEMLQSHSGESMMSFQQIMTVFQLLQWNGSLKAMKERCCSREEVIQHYSHRSIDIHLKNQMALGWVTRERDYPGTLIEELNKAQSEIENVRVAGRELRFHKEKISILYLAQADPKLRTSEITLK